MSKAKHSLMAPVPRTATAAVHDAIKQRILDGDYQAHQYIREANVAKELEVSRTPVREAIRELVSEGWLESIPHHGARVTAWTAKDAAEVFELRLALEPMAVGTACQHMDADRLAYLESLASRMEALTETIATAPDARNDIALLNHEFHRELIRASERQRLITVLESVVPNAVIRRNFTHYDAKHLRRSMHHHREILQAISAGHPSWAENIMRAHLLAARDLHTRFPSPST